MTDVKLTERIWTDKFGSHRLIRAVGASGRIYEVTLTKTALGWVGLEKARADVQRVVLADNDQRLDVPGD